jgi:hypothetical protein
MTSHVPKAQFGAGTERRDRTTDSGSSRGVPIGITVLDFAPMPLEPTAGWCQRRAVDRARQHAR